MNKRESVEEILSRLGAIVTVSLSEALDKTTEYLDQLAEEADELTEKSDADPKLIVDPGLPKMGDRVRLRENCPPEYSDDSDEDGSDEGELITVVALGKATVQFDSGSCKVIPVQYLIKESAEEPVRVEEEEEASADWYAEDRVQAVEETTRRLSEQHRLFVRHVRQAVGARVSEDLSDNQLVSRVREQRAQLEAFLKRLGAPDGSQIVTAIEALESLQNSAQAMAKEVADLQREIKMLRREEGIL